MLSDTCNNKFCEDNSIVISCTWGTGAHICQEALYYKNVNGRTNAVCEVDKTQASCYQQGRSKTTEGFVMQLAWEGFLAFGSLPH